MGTVLKVREGKSEVGALCTVYLDTPSPTPIL